MNTTKTCQICGTTWTGQETPDICPKEGCPGISIPEAPKHWKNNDCPVSYHPNPADAPSITPRTDTLVAEINGNDETYVLFAIRRLVNLARQLERELISCQRSLHSTQDLLAASERRWQRDIVLTEAATIERCAKVCDQRTKELNRYGAYGAEVKVLAEAIRALAPDRTKENEHE